MDTVGASSHEALEAAARLAYELAPRLCHARATRESCAWLHAFWPCLRIIGLAASPDRHASFYAAAFAEIGADARVLISGAADHGMLARLLSTRPAARVTVIDTCDTPLALNRWHAERAGVAIETQRTSVLDYAGAEPFDAICSHSFLGQFSHAERPRLVAAWRGLLRAGGRVIISHPLRPLDGEQPNRFTPQQERLFRERLRDGTPHLSALLGVGAADILRLTEAYLRARYGYPVHSHDEIAAYFEAGGFALERLDCKLAPKDAPPGSGGPGLRNPAVQYAYVIASRR
jgi:SAM-dependent methyltransferase